MASDGAVGDCFGRSVVVSLGLIAVRAHKHDQEGDCAGAVYMYIPDTFSN